MMGLDNFIKSAGQQLAIAGTILCFLTLGCVSIGNAQTSTLTATFKGKGFCDDGDGGAEKDNATVTATVVIDFDEFPEVEMTFFGDKCVI